jgi:hypothetical protein
MVNQQVIIRLLARIPSSQGGMSDDWSSHPTPGADGICAPALADAIWKFQQHWKANGTFKNIDGVVDPGGNTLRVMNTLIMGADVRNAGGASGQLPPGATNLTNLVQAIRSACPVPSKWTLTNAPGIGAGFIASGQIGQLDVKEDGARDEQHLTFASGGVEMGWSPEGTSPVTFSASTRDMWSATSIKALSGMGRIFSRFPSLSFDDMTGPIAVVGITGAAPMAFFTDVGAALGGKMIQGLSFSVFLLGINPSASDALSRLPSSNLTSGMMSAVRNCKAICMSAGEVMGVDLSIGLTIGYATGIFGKWDFLDQVQNNEAANAYNGAKKTVTDTVTNAANNVVDNFSSYIKDWGRN